MMTPGEIVTKFLDDPRWIERAIVRLHETESFREEHQKSADFYYNWIAVRNNRLSGKYIDSARLLVLRYLDKVIEFITADFAAEEKRKEEPKKEKQKRTRRTA